jgi:hypothetical protein
MRRWGMDKDGAEMKQLAVVRCSHNEYDKYDA